MSSIVSIDTRGYDISMGPGMLRVGGGGGLAGNVYINGNVGIGVVNPTARLEVSSTGLGNNTQVNITSTAASASTTNTSTLNLNIKGAGGGMVESKIVTAYSSFEGGQYVIQLKPQDTNVLNVFSSGKVGIGTSSQAATLDVNGTFKTRGLTEIARTLANPNVYVEMDSNSTVNLAFIDFHTGTTHTDYDSRIIADGGNGTSSQGNINIYATNIGLNGTVGIGTTSPAYTLDVNGTANIRNGIIHATSIPTSSPSAIGGINFISYQVVTVGVSNGSLFEKQVNITRIGSLMYIQGIVVLNTPPSTTTTNITIPTGCTGTNGIGILLNINPNPYLHTTSPSISSATGIITITANSLSTHGVNNTPNYIFINMLFGLGSSQAY